MAQAGYTPISLYHTTSTGVAPTAGNLVNGELAINIADGVLYYKDNLGAVKSISGATATYTRTSFTATAGQTTFTVSYTVGFVQVYLNGVFLNGTDFTATNGTTVVLATGAALNDIVEVIAYNVVNIGVANTATNLAGGIASQIPYQTGAGATAFIANGTSGQVLMSNGTAVPSWGTVSVAGGGTGATTLTANNVILGNGTSAVQFVAPGSSGNVLTSNGTTWQSTAPAAGSKAANVQTFNSSGTWTKPTGYGASARVLIEVWGGGGGGAKGTSTADNAAGGGGGGYNYRWIALSAMGATETITIGAGGAARTTAGNGNIGGNSSVGSLITSYGGGGGQQQPASVVGGGGGGQLSAGSTPTSGGPQPQSQAGSLGRFPEGAGGSGSTNNDPAGQQGLYKGGGGGAAAYNGCVPAATGSPGGESVWGGGGGGAMGTTTGGAGGTSSFGGNGGAGGSGSGNGTTGTQPGGGGGGARSNATTSGGGGAGRVVITVFDGA